MKKTRYFPAILLALLLALSLLPNTALAAGGPHPFTDVTSGAWYNNAVQYVYDNGLMAGTGDATFSPDVVTSRGMIVTILHRMEGTPSAAGIAFTDVPAGEWYTDAVAWASANGIVAGYDDGTYRPNDTIAHEQITAILYRYANYKGYNVAAGGDLSAFPGGDTASAYAVEALKWAVGVGLYEGAGGELSPAGGVTRAQAAVVLMHFCEDVASGELSVLAGLNVTCEPSGILALGDGSFLVTDTYNKTVWSVANGSSTVYAGGGSAFKCPWAIAPFGGGCAVSDAEAGVVRLISGRAVTTLDATFRYPTGLACDVDGNLYVADTHAGTVYLVAPGGNVSAFATGLKDPMGLCWKNGTLYIAEAGANRIVKIADGQIALVAGNGEDGLVNGPAGNASFSVPQGVAVGDDGTVYVSDTINGAVRQIKDGVVTTLAQRDPNDVASHLPTSPVGLALRGNQLYVCDNFARAVFAIPLAR